VSFCTTTTTAISTTTITTITTNRNQNTRNDEATGGKFRRGRGDEWGEQVQYENEAREGEKRQYYARRGASKSKIKTMREEA